MSLRETDDSRSVIDGQWKLVNHLGAGPGLRKSTRDGLFVCDVGLDKHNALVEELLARRLQVQDTDGCWIFTTG